MKIAKVIVSEYAIPFSNNGSWSQRIEYLLKSELNSIDYFICPKTNQSIETKTTFFRVNQNKSKLILKFDKNYRYRNFTSALLQLLDTNDQLIICIIDNVKLKTAITDFINKKHLKSKVKIIFYNCGYSYYFDNQFNKEFYGTCDEVIFLTESAYLFNKNKYIEFTPEVSVLHNPIDKTIYKPITTEEKNTLKSKNKLNNKTIYLWLSNDRKNKGLDIVLNAWKDWQKPSDAVLLVVGANRDENINGVKFIGTIPSTEVVEYYRIADVYLFSTLVKEGFGLSLAQAIACGCFCIVSNNGGVSEFFRSNNGISIDSPNRTEIWTESLELAYHEIVKNHQIIHDDNQLLDMNQWCEKFLSIFQKWERRLMKKS
jgi:glycosyltransferase involved in cell wall biosynthesis